MNPVQKAIWYIESHSDQPVTLDDVASACHVSVFHLSRAFSTSTGISLMRYLRSRRLSEAAKRLTSGATDILRVALDAGYGSHEAFTRAFRDHFAITPEQARAQGSIDSSLTMEPLMLNSKPFPDVATPRFETTPPMTFAGITEHYDCDAVAGIPAQWQRFNAMLQRINTRTGDAAYGINANFDSNNNFDYMCAVPVTDVTDLPNGVTTLSLPSRKYAVFTHKGHVAEIRAVFGAIWNSWFPQSGQTPLEAPNLERYGPEFDPLTGTGGFEVWIPVVE